MRENREKIFTFYKMDNVTNNDQYILFAIEFLKPMKNGIRPQVMNEWAAFHFDNN